MTGYLRDLSIIRIGGANGLKFFGLIKLRANGGGVFCTSLSKNF